VSAALEALDVLLVDPPGLQKSGYNLGLAYLAGALGQSGVSVGIVDTNHCPDPEQACREHVEACRPRIVGLSIKSATCERARRLAAATRAVSPQTVLVAGGPHVSLDAVGFLESTAEFDFAFAGEAEEVFGRFVTSVLAAGVSSLDHQEFPGLTWREGDRARGGERALVRDLDGLSFPALHRFLNLDACRLPYQLLTSRGCPYPCSYCCVGEISSRRWRARSVEGVIAELRHFLLKYGNPSFEVDDDNFTLGLERAKRLCREMREIPSLPPWCCPNGIRGDRMDDELAELMRAANCDSVAFGVESAVESVLTANQKRESLAAIGQAAKVCRAKGIKTWGYFIVGLPQSTFDDDLQSVRFGQDGPFDGCIYNLFVPYPGTAAWDWVARNGRYLRDYRNTLHFGERATPVFDTPEYPAKERILLHQITETSLGRLPDTTIQVLREQVGREQPAICTIEADSYLPEAGARLLGSIPAACARIADGGADVLHFARGGQQWEVRLDTRLQGVWGKLTAAAQILRFVRQSRTSVLLLPYTPLFRVLFLASGCRLAVFYDSGAAAVAETRLDAYLRLPGHLARSLLRGGRDRVVFDGDRARRRSPAPDHPAHSWRHAGDYLARIAAMRARRFWRRARFPRTNRADRTAHRIVKP
jgi:radical SAM superfamily enzyme YgiQ (UPF0313 family)